MPRKYILPVLAGVGFLFAVFMVIMGMRKPSPPPILFPPPHPPFKSYIAGSGITEASSQNISIGTAISGVVEEVFVTAGDNVAVGDLLFRVDTRLLLAQYQEAKSAKDVAVAEFVRQLSLPRPEDVPPVEAQVKQAEVHFLDLKTQWELYESLSDKRAVSVNDYNQSMYAAHLAYYQLQESRANLALLKAGAWIRDLEIASARIDVQEANMRIIETNLERASVRSPVKGQVLQVNLHLGEFVQAGALDDFFRSPLMMVGSIDPFHIRVDIDEEDAWRFQKNAAGIAYVRGNSALHVPLEYVRTEPYVIPKTSLTGDVTERVDTRVLQVIYKFNKGDLPIYMGQIMDVYLEVGERP